MTMLARPLIQDLVKTAMVGAASRAKIAAEAARQNGAPQTFETLAHPQSVGTDYALKLAAAVEYAAPFVVKSAEILEVTETSESSQLPGPGGYGHGVHIQPTHSGLQRALSQEHAATQMANTMDDPPGDGERQDTAMSGGGKTASASDKLVKARKVIKKSLPIAIPLGLGAAYGADKARRHDLHAAEGAARGGAGALGGAALGSTVGLAGGALGGAALGGTVGALGGAAIGKLKGRNAKQLAAVAGAAGAGVGALGGAGTGTLYGAYRGGKKGYDLATDFDTKKKKASASDKLVKARKVIKKSLPIAIPLGLGAAYGADKARRHDLHAAEGAARGGAGALGGAALGSTVGLAGGALGGAALGGTVGALGGAAIGKLKGRNAKQLAAALGAAGAGVGALGGAGTGTLYGAYRGGKKGYDLATDFDTKKKKASAAYASLAYGLRTQMKLAEDALNPAHISAGSEPAMPPGALASEERGGGPVGGSPQGPTGLVASNLAAINYKRRDAYAGRKRELSHYFSEPALSSRHDKTLGAVFNHTGVAGTKLT